MYLYRGHSGSMSLENGEIVHEESNKELKMEGVQSESSDNITESNKKAHPRKGLPVYIWNN